MKTFLRLLPAYTSVFFGFVGYALAIAIFTPMLMETDTGFVATDTAQSMRIILVGVLASLYPLGQFFGAPILGAFSDRFGRKSVLLFSLGLATICYLLIAMAIVLTNLWFLMLVTFIEGFLESNFVLAQGAVADAVEPKNRGHYIAYTYLFASTAFLLGPLIGGKLALINYSFPFWVVSVLLACNTLFVACCFRETLSFEKRHKVSYGKAFANLLQVFRPTPLRRLYCINFLIYLAVFGFFRCAPIYIVDEFKVGVSRLSQWIAWYNVPILLGNLWFVGWVIHRFSAFRVLLVGSFFLAISVAVVALPSVQWSLWITLVVAGASIAFCLTSAAVNLSTAVDGRQQGRVMGNNQGILVGAEALSGFLGGLITSIFVKLGLIACGIVGLAAALLLLRSFSKRAY